MLSLQLNNLGKKYNKEWVFRNLNFTIIANQKLVILGGNGSGKSTLLQIISGFLTQNEGEIDYSLTSKKIESQELKNYISFASPYFQLIEEFTLQEILEHCFIFKPYVNNFSVKQIIDLIELEGAKNKLVKQFSSGMKQRLKLGLAILSDTPLLLLDEPLSNLDKKSITWYQELVVNHCKKRTVIVCSNAIDDEFNFCNAELNVMDYKK